jgi:predicted nucleic acid-binding Zn ribbon protein
MLSGIRPARRGAGSSCVAGGSHVPGEGLERARRALAEAKADAAAKGARPKDPDGGAAEPAQPGQAGPRSARRPRMTDPQPLAGAIDGLLAEHGWGQRAAVGGAFGRWAQIVGADLAAHAHPESYADGELVVAADSTAWATQLRLLAGELVRRLNAELGDGTVRRVRVRGPSGEPGRGGWRVRGGRGPRDTYG